MTARVTIDKAGRVVLPKALRDRLHLSAGDTLELTLEGEEVLLRPKHPTPTLQRERGVWVLRTGQPMTAEEVEETTRSIREARERRDLGGLR